MPKERCIKCIWIDILCTLNLNFSFMVHILLSIKEEKWMMHLCQIKRKNIGPVMACLWNECVKSIYQFRKKMRPWDVTRLTNLLIDQTFTFPVFWPLISLQIPMTTISPWTRCLVNNARMHLNKYSTSYVTAGDSHRIKYNFWKYLKVCTAKLHAYQAYFKRV